jgi:hypothetical protein
LGKNTWRIGGIENPVGDVVLYLHSILQDAQDVMDLQSALAGEMKSSFGIILTAKGTLSLPPYATVQLQDVLSLNQTTGNLTVVGDLRAIAGVPLQRNGGRPNDYRKPLNDLIALRASQGRSLQGRNEEAKALLAEFKVEHPNKKSPSLPTIKKYVSQFRSGS